MTTLFAPDAPAKPIEGITPLGVLQLHAWLQRVQTIDGYDYEHQAWVEAGRYVSCHHRNRPLCHCYGTLHAGELVKPSAVRHILSQRSSPRADWKAPSA